ncbi:MAG: hypothetical protein IJ377_03000 [Rikenellaceae bacterium]|nr:hypothetical protein [Rikenellaceae bacterium]
MLDELREINYRAEFDVFTLYRTIGRTHHQHFDAMLKGKKVACVYFDRYGAAADEPYIWIRIENFVLYDMKLLVEVLSLTQLLDLTFNNITHLDLARDFSYNISERIRSLMRNPELKTIVNGKQIKDRDAALKGITRTCRMSLNRDKTKSLTIKQAKAIKNKYDGITLDSYDKMDEITSKSEKRYILDYYGNPKRLYRLELRLNNQDIRKISDGLGIAITEDVIYDKERLDALYIQALQSMLRFTDGRKKLDWQMLFDCNLRYR